MQHTLVPKFIAGFAFLLAGILISQPAGAQQPVTPAALGSGLAIQKSSSVQFLGPVQPSCTDPTVPCPAGAANAQQPRDANNPGPYSDAFGTAFGACATCIADTTNPGGPGCQFSQWNSNPTPPATPTAPQLQVQKFQPPDSCFTLVQAELRVRGTLCGLLRVESRDPVNTCFDSLSLAASIEVTPAPGQGLDFLSLLLQQLLIAHDPPLQTLGPFDGTVDFMHTPPPATNPSGFASGVTIVCPPTSSEQCFRITDPLQLAAFIDNGGGSSFLFFDHRADDSSSSIGCAPQTFKSDPFAGVEIEIVYTYCVSNAPVTVNDSARVCAGGSVDINVLGNDSDPEGDLDCGSLAVNITPTHGTAVVMGCSGSGASCPGCFIRYTPNAGYVGPDSFSYSVSDASGLDCSSKGQVTIDVCRTTALPDSGEVCQGSSVSIPVTANDSSTCGSINCATITIVDQPTVGTVMVNGCNIVYTTDGTNFTGPVTFTYTVANSSRPVCASAPATVTVEVCRTNARDDSFINVCAGSSIQIPVLGNDITFCGQLDTSSLMLVTPPAHGTATIRTFPFAGGTTTGFTYVPSAGYVGPDTFSYSVASDTTPFCSDIANVNLTVCETVANDDSGFRVCEGSGTISIPVTANDTTTCGQIDCSTLSITQQPAQGSAVVNGCSIDYTPPANFAGVVTFQYRVCNSIGACCDTATVSVEVCRTTAVDDTGFRICRGGGTLLIPVTANDLTTCGSLDCTSITITSPPAQGSAVRNGCNIVYTPPGGSFTGVVTFQYSICNNTSPACCDTATVSLEVCATDAVNDTGLRVCAGAGPLAIPVTLNDTTSCGALACSSITITSPPSQGTATPNGCSINYTPPADFAGVVTFGYRICNDTDPACCDEAQVSVEVCRTIARDDGRQRVCVGDQISIPVTTNDTTSCGTLNCASITIVTPPLHGSAVRNGCNVTYTSTDLAFTGVDTFTYSICNNTTPACCDTATVSVEVCATKAVDDTDITVCQGDGPISIPVTLNDSTTCGALNCASITITTPPAQGSATPNGCNIDYTPPASFVGTVSFGYRICNDSSPACCDEATVTIDVCRVVALPDEREICVGESVAIPVTGNDSSSCGALDCATITIVTPPLHGTAVRSGCNVTYTSTDLGFSGVDTFQYRVCNDVGCCGTALVSIQINPLPVALDDDATKPFGSLIPIVVPVLDNDFGGGAGCLLVPDSVSVISQGIYGTAVANPDGTITYTPNAKIPEGMLDQFCYEVFNDCGCRDTACVRIEELQPACPTRNRRQPGSLLLFPEFDNRGENLTYITITNTNCSQQSGAVDVHIYYVDDQTCLKNDFTISLTPCDTWTAITSAHNPNFQRGFIYAFAKSRTTGKAISFNYLIGNEIVIDGIDAFDYGINTVVFKAIPAQGQLTDLDNDNIRDFDGVEYEEAPDRILVPRFLGQDPAGNGQEYRSELVLIALSGGRAFTTVVDFLIYNDNEEVFSGAYTIDCWDKPRLTEISGVFLETFLKSTEHDPLEIQGDPTREAGWFNVDGQLANSTAETIIDPAIYAVLVERRGPWSVADLPWEECVQKNADLCPMSIFGDGPDYVAGDNE